MSWVVLPSWTLHCAAVGALAGVVPGWQSEIHLGHWCLLQGHHGGFIFVLSDLRMPVPVSMALNFMKLCGLGIFNILSTQFPKATENAAFPPPFRGSARRHPRPPLLWGMSLPTFPGYSQGCLPWWPPTPGWEQGAEEHTVPTAAQE